MKPKGVINPCGYTAVSNVEDVLAKKQKKLGAILGSVGDILMAIQKFVEMRT